MSDAQQEAIMSPVWVIWCESWLKGEAPKVDVLKVTEIEPTRADLQEHLVDLGEFSELVGYKRLEVLGRFSAAVCCEQHVVRKAGN